MAGTPYELVHGAAWVLLDGRVIRIPGFHSAWLASHPSIASGAVDTASFVRKSGWISAVLHEAGYLELIARSSSDARQRESLWNIVSVNAKGLERVVLMVLGMEGVLDLSAADFSVKEKFEAALDAQVLLPE